MSATYCPFDNCFCQKKESYFLAFQRAISQVGGLFKINPGAFEGCPIEAEDDRVAICSRYQESQMVLTAQQGKVYEQR